MAARYGGPNSIDWRHFGRLAGFTNRKPLYVNKAGRYPFISIDESTTKAGNYVNSAPIRTLIAVGVQRLKQEKHEQADAQKTSPGCALLALAVPVGPADIGRHSERRDWLPVRHVAQLGGFPEIADVC